MDNTSLQKKQIAVEIDNLVKNDFQIDTSHDAELLIDKNYSWNDLNQLREELGNLVLEFVGQVNGIILNPSIVSNLGNKATHFNKLVSIFFNDINEFSSKVKELRLQHEDKSGPVADINEFNTYNRLAINYHSLYVELSTLVAPTMSDIMITISEILPQEQAPADTNTGTQGS